MNLWRFTAHLRGLASILIDRGFGPRLTKLDLGAPTYPASFADFDVLYLLLDIDM